MLLEDDTPTRKEENFLELRVLASSAIKVAIFQMLNNKNLVAGAHLN